MNMNIMPVFHFMHSIRIHLKNLKSQKKRRKTRKNVRRTKKRRKRRRRGSIVQIHPVLHLLPARLLRVVAVVNLRKRIK
jgi:hypothetical protein